MSAVAGARFVVEADGAARGNPGPAGYGAVVKDAEGRVLAETAEAIGVATNNVAEYRGLIAGLRALLGLGAEGEPVEVRSQLPGFAVHDKNRFEDAVTAKHSGVVHPDVRLSGVSEGTVEKGQYAHGTTVLTDRGRSSLRSGHGV